LIVTTNVSAGFTTCQIISGTGTVTFS
jgi:hypothetical protein